MLPLTKKFQDCAGPSQSDARVRSDFILVVRSCDENDSKKLPLTLLSRPFLVADRPPLVILPASGNLQISWRKTLHSKTKARGECFGKDILRLDICFDPVQPEAFECIGQRETKRFGHITLAGEFPAYPVPDEGALQIASKNLREIADPHYLEILPSANQASAHRFAARILQIPSVRLRSRGRCDPGMKKTPTGNNETSEFIHVAFPRMT
jgi:hypothetical protein